MMSRSGDLNLNRSVQAFGDSTMERLKQAMLQHELIFRNQVCELHRLYWTQRNLMNQLRIKAADTDAPSNYSWLSKESEEKKNSLSMSSRAKESSLAGNVEEFNGKSTCLLRSHQRELSLRLPSDDFIRDDGEDPAFYHQAINFRCKEVIDLESSVELEFNEVMNDPTFSGCFRAPMQNGAGVFGTQLSVPCARVSSSLIGNIMAPVIQLSEENGGQLQEQKLDISYVAGFGDSCIDSSVSQTRKKQQPIPILFDLNLPHEDDESAHHLKGKLQQESNNSRPAETSFVPQSPLSDISAKNSCENRTIHLIFHGADSKSDCSVDSKPADNTADDKNDTVSGGRQIQAECCEGSTDSCDRVSLGRNSLSNSSSMDLCKQVKDNVDSSTDKLRSSSHSGDIKRQDSNITSSNSINLAQAVNKDSMAKPFSNEGSEEDTSSSHAVSQDEIAPSRKNSHGLSRNNESSNTDDSVTTHLNSSQNEDIGKSNPEEWNTAIISAAEALMSFPLGCSSIPIEKPNLPQHSSDSFERMTLQLPEVQSEDRRIMSEPSNVNKTGKNERGVRLRRGRGFRDFQKEILPGLVTLSRHEICEDLHNICYRVRRVRSRIGGDDDWFVPVRSRRSKPRSGGRRRA